MKKIIKRVIGYLLIIGLVVGLLFTFVDKVEKVAVNNDTGLTYSIDKFSNDFKKVSSLTKREQDIICASSRGLIEIDSSGKILPSLAESVQVSSDGIQYDFKIRNDVYWSDGSQITSTEIVEYFRQAILEEDTEDISALLDIYGAKTYREGTGSFSKEVAMQAKDDRIIIRLNNKNDNFLTELSKPQYRVRENILMWDNLKTNYSQIRYSGDYKISAIEDKSITLVKNDKITKNLSDKIVFVQDESEEVAMAAFEVGNRDIVINPPRGQLERLKGENRLITMESDKGMYLAYNPNSSLPVSGRKDIYRKIVKAMEGYKNSNPSLLVMSEGSYFRKDKENLDKLQARKVSINSDQEWDEEKIIKIVAEETTQNKEICLSISNWFKDNTKQTVVYDLLNREEMKKLSKEDKYDILLLENYNNPNGDNGFYVKAESYLPKELLVEIEGKNIQTEFSKIEETLFNSCIILPLVFFNDSIAINTEVENITLDGNGNIVF